MNNSRRFYLATLATLICLRGFALGAEASSAKGRIDKILSGKRFVEIRQSAILPKGVLSYYQDQPFAFAGITDKGAPRYRPFFLDRQITWPTDLPYRTLELGFKSHSYCIVVSDSEPNEASPWQSVDFFELNGKEARLLFSGHLYSVLRSISNLKTLRKAIHQDGFLCQVGYDGTEPHTGNNNSGPLKLNILDHDPLQLNISDRVRHPLQLNFYHSYQGQLDDRHPLKLQSQFSFTDFGMSGLPSKALLRLLFSEAAGIRIKAKDGGGSIFESFKSSDVVSLLNCLDISENPNTFGSIDSASSQGVIIELPERNRPYLTPHIEVNGNRVYCCPWEYSASLLNLQHFKRWFHERHIDLSSLVTKTYSHYH